MSTPTLAPGQAQRLADETIAWLTTVNAEGAPAPTPVWFLWTGAEFLVFSKPRTAKLAGIGRNPLVALHLNSDAHGGDVLVVTGTARVDEAGVSEQEWGSYAEKYGRGFRSLGVTPEAFADDYSVLLRITPERVRGW
ncbi:TIGR03667 family PPOX class F420-dependent oxidoreductase [Pseudonocardia ailaonensis]|uniref:TIGR03667 family PPOX class F420-dependent oxidoreductase n=1 Tax=Pseudonocardia ailaonensis TaxID=367279 RepID=A0ABN2NJN2_9PSEU